MVNRYTISIKAGRFEIDAPTYKCALRAFFIKYPTTPLQGLYVLGEDLSFLNLGDRNLKEVRFNSCNLLGVDFSRSDLTGAYFGASNICGACFYKACVDGVKWPSPTMVLSANWRGGLLSRRLTRDLMRYDAYNHPYPARFLAWGAGGDCPYSGTNTTRMINFEEDRTAIGKDFLKLKPRSAYSLMQSLIRETCRTNQKPRRRK